MKNIIAKISIWAAAALVAAVSFTACEDEPDRFRLTDGKPTVYYIRPVKAAAADSLLTSAYMGNSICLVGDNLRSVYKMLFNDQQAVLNNSYITDHTLLVDVPNEIPGEVSNMIYLINKNADTVKVDFQVLVPGPTISSMSNEFAPKGTLATLYGDYFVDDPNVPIQLWIGDAECSIKSFTKGAINFEVPAGATILDAANKINVHIPKLCYCPDLGCGVANKPASCRLCLVEATGIRGPRKILAPACATPVAPNMEVWTNSARAMKARRTVLELLLSSG